jgi:hypothetical protein
MRASIRLGPATERFGFRPLADPPPEIAAKLRGVCDRLRSGVIAMVRERNPPPIPPSSP